MKKQNIFIIEKLIKSLPKKMTESQKEAILIILIDLAFNPSFEGDEV